MRAIATFMIIVGVIVAAIGYFASGAAPGGTTLNIGLLNDKLVLAVVGAALFVAGVVVGTGLAIMDKLDDASRALSAADSPLIRALRTAAAATHARAGGGREREDAAVEGAAARQAADGPREPRP